MAQQQESAGGISMLSVVWYKVLPPKYGGQKGVALFTEYLGRLALLTCLCARNNGQATASYRIVNTLPTSKRQFFDPLCWRTIYTLAKKVQATHLLLEFPYHGIAGFLCKRLLGLKLIVHEHNIEALRFKEQKKWWWQTLFSYEKWVLKKADLVLVKTEKDKAAAMHYFGITENKLAIVPYGIETAKSIGKQKAKQILFERHGVGLHEKLLLFAGTLDYGPNAEAVRKMQTILVPLLAERNSAYKIIFCGRIVYKEFSYLKELQTDKLIYAGEVADIETYFSAADVFLDPVITGGGVQTKIVDALSFNLNVVCFEEQTEGIEGAGEKLFTAPKNNWSLFADAVLSALEKDKPTPEDFFKHHDWNTIVQKTFNRIQTI